MQQSASVGCACTNRPVLSITWSMMIYDDLWSRADNLKWPASYLFPRYCWGPGKNSSLPSSLCQGAQWLGLRCIPNPWIAAMESFVCQSDDCPSAMSVYQHIGLYYTYFWSPNLQSAFCHLIRINVIYCYIPSISVLHSWFHFLKPIMMIDLNNSHHVFSRIYLMISPQQIPNEWLVTPDPRSTVPPSPSRRLAVAFVSPWSGPDPSWPHRLGP